MVSRTPRPPAGVFDLAAHGGRVAVHADGRDLDYAELAALVAARAIELGPGRRLVLLAAGNHLESLVTYLAALAAGHPLLLAPGDHPRQVDRLIAAHDPDVVASGTADRWQLDERRPGSAHTPHPDLALLTTTSGSTGSPKLVRLSHANLRSNAASIARSLRLSPEDRAITSLPMHYCYGLSVVNSHLLVGGSLVLTDASVVDEEFWRLARDERATSLAGVPYTFDLLDQVGFADRPLPALRRVTQAGGRLSPDQVQRHAELGRRRGWDFYVMYGQAEATARMACLPPEVAAERPGSIGVPIPGGAFRLDPVDDDTLPDGSGELVYHGPNVMMGYATGPADLARGPELAELRTGDLARRDDDGLWTLVGRKGRFAKVFGCRVDLDDLELTLREHGLAAACVAPDDALWVFVEHRREVERARELTAAACGVPGRVVHVVKLEALPRTASGKVDQHALTRHAAVIAGGDTSATRPRGPVTAARLRDLYAEILGRPDATESGSFTSLGGDSLSYVELSVRLGALVGALPRDWHTRSIADLAALASDRPSTPRRPWRTTSVEASVLVRAAAIVLIVANHANLLTWYGGAHVLLAVVGFNFARFAVGSADRAGRWRAGATTIRRILVPSVAWIGAVAIITGMYAPSTALMLNGLLGSDRWTTQWQFWFLEAILWTMAASAAVLALPSVDRLERRAPFGFALAALALALATRYALVGVEAGPTERYTPVIVWWCFALGWAAAKARETWQRLVVTAVAAVAAAGFFGDPLREATVVVGVAVVVWAPAVRLPRPVALLAGILASSSLYVYLTHWQVYPHLEVDHPLLAVIASFAVGVGCWQAVTWWGRSGWPWLRAVSGQRRRPRPAAPHLGPAGRSPAAAAPTAAVPRPRREARVPSRG